MTTLGEQAVGSIVKMNFGPSGAVTATNFIVVHQGNPNPSIYGSSCDGTWLLMEDIYATEVWNNANNSYASSNVHSYLNNDLYYRTDTGVRGAIKESFIPCTGSNNCWARMFLLSLSELGISDENANIEGATLDYFSGASDSKRIAKYNGSALGWSTRSPKIGDATNVAMVSASGAITWEPCSTSMGIRPALVLSPAMRVTDDGTLQNSVPTSPGVPFTTSKVKSGTTITISWAASNDVDGDLSGYKLTIFNGNGIGTTYDVGLSTSYDYTIPYGAESLTFRVAAYDSLGASASSSASIEYPVTKITDAISGYTTIDGVDKQLTGEGYVTINGVLKPLVKCLICYDSVWKSASKNANDNDIEMKDLPAGYIQLEWIKSTGTQYIDTGVCANYQSRLILDAEMDHTFTGATIQKAGYGSTSQNWYMWYAPTTSNWYRAAARRQVNFSSACNMNGRFLMDNDCGTVTFSIGDVTETLTAAVGTYSSKYTLYLFAQNSADKMAYPSAMTLYSFKMYASGTLVRDFVPCMNPDGIVGLYDVVGGEFYPNLGTGEFIAGEPVR